MNVYNINPEKKNPYRRCGMAMAIYTFGVTSFAALNISLHHTGMAANGGSVFCIGRFELSRIDLFECVETIFLLTMAFVFISQYRRAKSQSVQGIEEINLRLRLDYQKLQKNKTALEEAMRELERFNTMAMGREQRILELKSEVNALLQEANQAKRYNTALTD